MFYYLNPSIVVYSIMVIFNAMCMYKECDSYHVFEKSQRACVRNRNRNRNREGGGGSGYFLTSHHSS